VVTFGEITQLERSIWQCRAAAELAAILRTHSDLPLLAWTVASAGSVLLGRVATPARAPETRAVFDAWKTALLLEESPSASTEAMVHLRAEARRNQVCVRLTATVFAAEGNQ
jgi:hypothetical protein